MPQLIKNTAPPDIVMETLLITGGKGFIGRNLIEELSSKREEFLRSGKRWQVPCPSQVGSSLDSVLKNMDTLKLPVQKYQDFYRILAPLRTELDLTNQAQVNSFFSEETIDCIIHAAALGVTNTRPLRPFPPLGEASQQGVLQNNLLSLVHLFEKRNLVKRLIHLGSGAEYGRPLQMRQISEDRLGSVVPQDEYGLSKLLATKILSSEAPEKAVTLHLFGVFGPFEDYQVRFISYAIIQSLLKMPININQNVEFDYLYIKDLTRIIKEFIHRPAIFHSYNVTTGVPITLLEIVELIREVTGIPQEITIKKQGLGASYTGSNQRLLSFLGPDFQFTPIKKSIEEFVLWHEKNLNGRQE